MLTFTAYRADFCRAVARASQGLPSRPVKPVHAGLLIEPNPADDWLEVTGSDGDITFTALCEAEITELGSVVLPGRMLAEVSRYFTGEHVRLAVAGGTAEITAGRSAYRFSATDGKEYPRWTTPLRPRGQAEATTLGSAIRKVIPAVSGTEDQLRAVLMIPSGPLTLAATDRYRIAVASAGFTPTGALTAADSMILYPWILERFARVAEGTVTIGWNTGTVTLGSDCLQVTARQVESEFLVKELRDKTLPGVLADRDNWVTLETAALTRAVRACSVVAGGEAIELEFNGEDAVVSALGETGKATEYVATDVQPEEVKFILGTQLLLDGLSGCGETVRLSFTRNPLAPVLMDSEGFRYLLKPRRDLGDFAAQPG